MSHKKSCVFVIFFGLSLLASAKTVLAESGHGHGVHVGADSESEPKLIDFEEDFQKMGIFKDDLAIFTFIVFILLLIILWRTAFGPISKALHERESKIRQDIDDAKAERLKAEELRSEYEGMLEAAEDKVRSIYAEANAKADEVRAKRVAEADAEAESRIQQAVQEIERAKDQAINELFEMENQRIVQATEHVLGRSLSDDDQNRLVNEALSQFSNN